MYVCVCVCVSVCVYVCVYLCKCMYVCREVYVGYLFVLAYKLESDISEKTVVESNHYYCVKPKKNGRKKFVSREILRPLLLAMMILFNRLLRR